MRYALAAIVLAVLIAGCGATTTASRPHKASPSSAAPGTTSTSTNAPRSAGANGESSVVPKLAAQVVPVVSSELDGPLREYTGYVDALLRKLGPQLQTLQSATSGGDLAAAERAWLPAHLTWLQIGQDDASYGAFGDLGESIDGLATGLPGTTANPKFTGFHKVELDLWRGHDSAAAARDTGALAARVATLTPAAVAGDLPHDALSLDSWVLRCHEILEDGLRDSLTQEDDYGSNSDLASLGADVTATREMLRVLAPLIASRAPRIVPDATAELHTLEQAIASAGESGVSVAALPLRRRQAVDAATGAALETLAPVSELMQVFTPGS